MPFEENWTPRPDSDSERAVPATVRKMAPWDSDFHRNGRRPESDAAELAADEWIVGAMMGLYNDGIIDIND